MCSLPVSQSQPVFTHSTHQYSSFTPSPFFYHSEFDPEYKLVASSFQKSKHAGEVFFGHLDFQDGQTVYQQVIRREKYYYSVIDKLTHPFFSSNSWLYKRLPLYFTSLLLIPASKMNPSNTIYHESM